MLRFLLRMTGLFFLWIGLAHATSIHLLPPGPLVADGKEEATLHVWIPRLAESDKVKVKPAQGKLIDVIRKPGGIIEVAWIPALEAQSRSIDIAVTHRKRGADPVVVNLPVTLSPPNAGTITIKATPAEWAPGQDAIQIKFSLNGTAQQAVSSRRIRVSSSVGSITEAVPLGDGTFTARWTPPAETLTARTVVISAVDEALPSTVVGWTSFPLLATQNMSFGATPNSQNVLVVGDREYGPVKATSAGTVAFDALVHPQIRKGLLRSTLRDGRTIDVPAPLPLTEYPRVHFLPQPKSIPAGAQHNILLVATTSAGEPLDTATIAVKASASNLGLASKTEIPGVYSLSTTPDQNGTIKLDAKMDDPEAMIGKIQTATSTLNVIEPTRTTAITADPNPFIAEKTVRLTSTVLTRAGAPITTPEPTLGITGAEVSGRPYKGKDGTVAVTVKSQGDTIIAAVTPNIVPSANTPAQVLVWPAQAAITPNASTPVIFAAVDAFGHPVPNVQFELASPNGGTLTGPATTSKHGFGLATYTASANPGLFSIHAKAAGLANQSVIFHGDEMAAPIPVKSGNTGMIRQREMLAKAIATIQIVKKKEAPAVMAAPVKPKVEPSPPAAVAEVAAPSNPIPEPVSAPTSPAVATPKPAKKARSSQRSASFLSGSTGDVYFGIVGSNHGFSQTADLPEDDSSNTSNLPPIAEFNRGLSPGFRFGGDYWLQDGPLGVTFDNRITFEKVAVAGDELSFANWSFQVGTKYRLGDLSFGTPYVLGTLQRSQTTLFKLSPAAAGDGPSLTADQQTLFGLRIGGGLVIPVGSGMELDVHLSELFGILPVQTNIGALFFYEMAPDLNLMTGTELYLKHVGLESGGIDVSINETEISLVAGVSYRGL